MFNTPKIDPEAIVEFLEHVWRPQPPGYMFMAIKDGDRWKQFAPLDWNSTEAHLKAILCRYATYDLYFCPTTFASKERKKRYAQWTKWLHCDIDGADVSVFDPRPTILWRTSPGRHQGLWFIDGVVEVHEAEGYNRAFAQYSDDGSGWEITKFLRVPGTYNNKRARPHLGSIVAVNGGSIKRRDLPEPIERKQLTQGDHSTLWSDAKGFDHCRVLKKYPKAKTSSGIPISRCMDAYGAHQRSSLIYAIIAALLAEGASDAEAACVVAASKVYRDRLDEFGERATRQDVERILEKLR